MKFVWDVDPVALHLGPVQIRWYGILFLGVFLGGYRLFRWQVLRAKGSELEADGILMPGMIGTLVGARLGHAFFYEPTKILDDPLWLFMIWKGGLASHGATLGLLASLLWYARYYRKPYLEVLDRFSFAAALSGILVRLGNFINSEIVGRATDQSWGVAFPRYDGRTGSELVYRYPTQFFEMGVGLTCLVALWAIDRRLGERRPRGLLIAVFFTLYFLGRFSVEFAKERQTAIDTFPLSMGQILSIPMALLGAAGIALAIARRVPAHWPAPAPPAAPAEPAA